MPFAPNTKGSFEKTQFILCELLDVYAEGVQQLQITFNNGDWVLEVNWMAQQPKGCPPKNLFNFPENKRHVFTVTGLVWKVR